MRVNDCASSLGRGKRNFFQVHPVRNRLEIKKFHFFLKLKKTEKLLLLFRGFVPMEQIHPRRNKSTKAPQAAADGVFESPPLSYFPFLFQKGKEEEEEEKIYKKNSLKNLYDRPMVVCICEANIHQPTQWGEGIRRSKVEGG
jgi:hypothetical protein